jgi:hypothetical protein
VRPSIIKNRLVASSKTNQFLKNEEVTVEKGGS